MIPGGESKRKLGDVWPQLVLSAGILLIPPLVMTAFVMHFGSPSSQGVGQQVVERADGRQLATSFALASVDEHPVMIEQRSVADGPATSTLNQATKQYTPAGNRSEQSVTAESWPLRTSPPKFRNNWQTQGAGHRPAPQLPSRFRRQLWRRQRSHILPHPPAQLLVPTRPVPGWFSSRPRRLKERRSRHTAGHRQNFRCWPAISSWFARRIRARAALSMRRKSVRSATVKPTNSAITSRVPVLAASSRGLHGNVWGPTAHAWLTSV
jgi:hypothetical protein